MWARAVCRAADEPLSAASHAVTVVPMFIPNTVTAAVSKLNIPCCVSVMTIADIAEDDCTTAVNTSERRTHFANPHAVVASSDLKTSMTSGMTCAGLVPSFIQ